MSMIKIIFACFSFAIGVAMAAEAIITGSIALFWDVAVPAEPRAALGAFLATYYLWSLHRDTDTW